MKKGFVFIETLIVLVVLTVSIVSLYSLYIKIASDINARRYYDNINDLYKTDVVRDYITQETLESTTNFITITPTNCNNYMENGCRIILETLNIENVYINNDDIGVILSSSSIPIKNSAREYMKTIRRSNNTRFIIVNFKYNGKNYYASLRI
ncbi:MAG: hypothetical protein HFE04_01480 [Bacilli bacterium]|nr:hypothetical protein [Bacilli bacterium]